MSYDGEKLTDREVEIAAIAIVEAYRMLNTFPCPVGYVGHTYTTAEQEIADAVWFAARDVMHGIIVPLLIERIEETKQIIVSTESSEQ